MRKLMRQSRGYRAYDDGFSIIGGILILGLIIWRVLEWIF